MNIMKSNILFYILLTFICVKPESVIESCFKTCETIKFNKYRYCKTLAGEWRSCKDFKPSSGKK